MDGVRLARLSHEERAAFFGGISGEEERVAALAGMLLEVGSGQRKEILVHGAYFHSPEEKQRVERNMLVRMHPVDRDAYLASVPMAEARHEKAGDLASILPEPERSDFLERLGPFDRRAIEAAMMRSFGVEQRLDYMVGCMDAAAREAYLDHVEEHRGSSARATMEIDLLERMEEGEAAEHLYRMEAELHIARLICLSDATREVRATLHLYTAHIYAVDITAFISIYIYKPSTACPPQDHLRRLAGQVDDESDRFGPGFVHHLPPPCRKAVLAELPPARRIPLEARMLKHHMDSREQAAYLIEVDPGLRER